MFGIGLPEMLVILALALIVVGPDKLPDLARSLAKGVMELKKTADGFKDAMEKEGDPLSETKKELEEAADSLKKNLLDNPSFQESNTTNNSSAEAHAQKAYEELTKNSVNTTVDDSDFIEIEPDLPPQQNKETTNSAAPLQEDKDAKNG